MFFTLRRVNIGNLTGPSLKAHYDHLEKLTLFEGELSDVVTENPALKRNFRPYCDNVNDVQYNEQDHESTEIELCDDASLTLSDVDQQLNVQSRLKYSKMYRIF